MHKLLKYLAFYAISGLALVLTGGCSQTPTEEAIRNNLEALETRIEEKKTAGALELFHSNFNTAKNFDKDWVKRTLLFHQVRHQNIEIVVTNVVVEPKDDYTAIARFNAVATGGQGLIPDQGALYKIETEWRKEGSDWLLIYAKWERS